MNQIKIHKLAVYFCLRLLPYKNVLIIQPKIHYWKVRYNHGPKSYGFWAGNTKLSTKLRSHFTETTAYWAFFNKKCWSKLKCFMKTHFFPQELIPLMMTFVCPGAVPLDALSIIFLWSSCPTITSHPLSGPASIHFSLMKPKNIYTRALGVARGQGGLSLEWLWGPL